MSTDVLIPTVRNVKDVGKKNTYFQVYVGRPTMWGNPYEMGVHGTREECVELFRRYFFNNPTLMAAAKDELRGKDLVCWCAPLPCHADILLAYVNQ